MTLKFNGEYERFRAIMIAFRFNYDNCKSTLLSQYQFLIDAVVNTPTLVDSDKIKKIQKYTAAYNKVSKELDKMHKEAEWLGNIPIFKDELSSPITAQLRRLDELRAESSKLSADAKHPDMK